MPGENSRLRILYLARMFHRGTDEEHTLTVPQIIEKLAAQNITADRRTIYTDIEALQTFGMDIEKRKTKTNDYYLANREFELAELKLLADAVQSSRFITTRKTTQLIEKLKKLASEAQARQLQRQIHVANRVKSMNESIYYLIDGIQQAIADNKKIAFKYYEYNINKQKQYRHDGADYVASPYIFIWDLNNYYLVAHSQEKGRLIHFRVDKMDSVRHLDEERVQMSRDFDAAIYAQRTFNMFTGELEDVTLRFDTSLIGVLIDRFGKNISICDKRDGMFTTTLKVVASPAFYTWVFQFGEHARILAPESAVHEAKKLIGALSRFYTDNE